jgi:hypothetical protein
VALRRRIRRGFIYLIYFFYININQQIALSSPQLAVFFAIFFMEQSISSSKAIIHLDS